MTTLILKCRWPQKTSTSRSLENPLIIMTSQAPGVFWGTVSGKAKAISLDGLVEITNPVIYGIKLDSVAGRVAFKDDKLRLSNILVARETQQVRLAA